MGMLKRICLFVFGLSGLLVLAALALPWFGPWSQEAQALMGVDIYYMVVECLIALVVLGHLACLLRSILTRNRKVVVVSRVDADQITVTRSAISSQVTHVIEEDGRFRARRVSVSSRTRGHVRVYARVQPTQTVDVVEEGRALHDRLLAGLAVVVGDNVDGVELEFLNAEEYLPEPAEASQAVAEGEPDLGPEPVADEAGGTQGAGSESPSQRLSPSDTSEITVSMGKAPHASESAEEE